jgi:hypothetical protein
VPGNKHTAGDEFSRAKKLEALSGFAQEKSS